MRDALPHFLISHLGQYDAFTNNAAAFGTCGTRCRQGAGILRFADKI